MFGVGLLWRGVGVALGLVGMVCFFLVIVPVAFAQSSVPQAPTAVAVYDIESEKLEVRWSSSDAVSTTAFRIQWKSGSEEFDSSRQLSSDPAASIVSSQSTSAGDRYKATLTGLSDGTEYTVRVVAANASGDSDPSGETTGTPRFSPGQEREFIEEEVVGIFESSYPWLRQTWDYMTTQNLRVVPVWFEPGASGQAGIACSPNRPMESNLRKCYVTGLLLGRSTMELIRAVTHELAHVYTLVNSVTGTPGPLGVAHLYFDSLEVSGDAGACDPIELYADALTYLVHGPAVSSSYFISCSGITDSLIEEAVAVVRSAASGAMPSWFATTYHDSNGEPDLERVWADVKAVPNTDRRAAVVFQLLDAFGGYCDNQKATDAAFGSGAARNPWNDGGCVPEAPTNVAATAVGSGKLTVSWQEPPGDGGSPIEGYKVHWKSGSQEYSSSRQAVVTSLSDRRRTVSGLTNEESHTLRVLAYNEHGDGAATEAMATPKATDTVTVTDGVTNVNEPPDAVADMGTVTEDGDVTIDVLANDSDPEDDRTALTLRVITNPRRGRASVNEPANAGGNRTITYRPNENYHGADFFTYEVRDTGRPSLSDRADVSVEVDAVNDPPMFTSPTATRRVSESADFGDRVGAPVTATDVDENDTLTYSLSGTEARFFDIGPRSGQVTVGDGVMFDIETKNKYTFMVDADDANGDRATVEVTVTIASGGGVGGGVGDGGGGGGFDDGGGDELPPTASELFDDVDPGVWYESAVSWMILHEVTSGCATNLFCPDADLTREQFVTFLWRAAGRPPAPYLGSEAFTDVREGGYAEESIGWAVANGITRGCTSGQYGDPDWQFCPTQAVTRGQMATLLYRHVEADYIGKVPSHTDIQLDDYYAVSVAWLTDFGVVPGCGAGVFCPDRDATRAEAAVFINGIAIRPHIWAKATPASHPNQTRDPRS